MSLPSGSFMIYGKKNFISPSKLEMGFGLLFRVDEKSAKNHLHERVLKVDLNAYDNKEDNLDQEEYQEIKIQKKLKEKKVKVEKTKKNEKIEKTEKFDEKNPKKINKKMNKKKQKKLKKYLERFGDETKEEKELRMKI